MKTTVKNKVWVPTVRTKSPTVGLKVPTAKPTVAADKRNKGKAVKALALIMKSLVKKKQKGAILELKRRYLKKV
ncbi:hypothetical protein Tco_0743000 [Tanacetum coccineum]